LCALTFEPGSFAAGISLFGVADAEALALETHKFESRYCDSMIGPYPERADLYRERSPVHFVDRLERPLLLLQGLDDEVVPPAQAEAMVEVLERKGIPYAYITFEGEGHGFRKKENIRRTTEAKLAFVGQVFGFEPADEPRTARDVVRTDRRCSANASRHRRPTAVEKGDEHRCEHSQSPHSPHSPRRSQPSEP